jgi:hypothetical protein
VLALRPAALTAQNRLFVEEIARWQNPQAKDRGIDGGETGSVTFVQHFDGTLWSFVHLHVVARGGVFTRFDDGAVRFHPGPAPSVADVAAVGKRVAERMHRWMRRGKMFDQRPPEERSNEAPELSPLEACMQLSLFGGTFLKLDKNGVPLVDDEDDERHRSRTKSPWSAEVQGFNVVSGHDGARRRSRGADHACAGTVRGRASASSVSRCSRMAGWRTNFASRAETARPTRS